MHLGFGRLFVGRKHPRSTARCPGRPSAEGLGAAMKAGRAQPSPVPHAGKLSGVISDILLLPGQTPLQEYWYLSNLLKNYFNFQEIFFFFLPPWQPGIDNKTMNNSHSFHALLNIMATTVRKFNHVPFIVFILHISSDPPRSMAMVSITCLKTYAEAGPVLHPNLILKGPAEIKA